MKILKLILAYALYAFRCLPYVVFSGLCFNAALLGEDAILNFALWLLALASFVFALSIKPPFEE